MYAVIMSGGKQYKVKENQRICIEKQDIELNGYLEFKNVLLVGNQEQVLVGKPYVKDCTVTAVVESFGKHKKVKILKFKRRKHHMKRMGHRQLFTKIKINSINVPTNLT